MAQKTQKAIPDIEYKPHREASAGVEICSIKSLYNKSPGIDIDPFAPHRVQFHHLLYIADGECRHLVDFDHYACCEGSFILVNKNQVHAFDRDNQPDGLMVLFTQQFLDSIHTSMRLPGFDFAFRHMTSSPVIQVEGDVKASCVALLSELAAVTGNELHDSLIIQLLLACLFLKLHQQEEVAGTVSVNEERRQQLLRFMSLIQANFHATKDATAYAEMMGITYKTLNEICKKSAQRTPKQLIDANTILEAKRRLTIDHTQVSQVAYDLGFNEITNFVKYFKKHTSETPSQFQRRLAG